MKKAITSQSKTDRKTLITHLYKTLFATVAAYISNRGGQLNDAQDIFQDAVTVWYEQKYVKKTANPLADAAYIMGITKNLWRKKMEKKGMEPLNEQHEQLAEAKEEYPSKERLLNYLSRAGSKCMELLQYFYYEQAPLTELAGKFGFSGVRSATVQKYKCLEKVRETIKEKSLQYEDFLD